MSNVCTIPHSHKYFVFIENLIINARKSNLNHKFAACIIQGKKIYSHGYNYCSRENIHAEISTLNNLNRNIAEMSKKRKTFDILIIRVTKSNKLANSRPCKSCFNALKSYGISRIFYSNKEGEIVYENVDEMKVEHTSSGFRYLHPELFPCHNLI
jgi:deoxycytidylate deaminase